MRTREDVQREIDNNFVNHRPDDAGGEKCGAIRAKAKELAELIADAGAPSREQALAITNLEQAMQWGIASVVRY